MAQENVIIIGAGVAGLAAGTYLRNSGFTVTILEQHTIPGGLSTSWNRRGYLFEGGMHWLTGSSPDVPLNRIWHEVGALKENNPVINNDPFYTYTDGTRQLCLYRDIDRFEEELTSFAPEDTKAIKRLCADMRLFTHVHLVVSDLPGVKVTHPVKPSMAELCAMVPVITRIIPLSMQSYPDYVSKFKNEAVRHLLLSVIGTRYNALSFIYPLASFSSGDCGYPAGGSIRMAQNMADTFTALGGTIRYRTKVTGIQSRNGRVTGVEADGTVIPADRVIVTLDTRKAVDTLFTPQLDERWVCKMRKIVISEQNMFLCVGIKADLSNYPAGFVIPLDPPLEAAGLTYSELCLHNYSRYDAHAPQGCTALTCLLLGPSYDWWKARKEDGTYRQEKENLMQRFIALLARWVPESAGNIEVTDVATPCTYERYTGSFEGSWMSVWKPGAGSFTFPVKTSAVDGVYFAGQRSMMPGGLPITVWAARRAAQAVCRDTHTVFASPVV